MNSYNDKIRRSGTMVVLIIIISTFATDCVYPYTGKFNDSQVLRTSASERYMVSRERAAIDGGTKNVICTEPSPDIAIALSAFLKSSVDVAGKATANTTISASQAIVQLGKRYAAIQTLRDMSYADCQAYANGVLTTSQYAAFRARTPLLAVTMLAMEMLGNESSQQSWTTSSDGNSRPSDAGVDPDAGASAGSSGTGGVFNTQKVALSDEQAKNINNIYTTYAIKVSGAPFAIACLGILEGDDARHEQDKGCIDGDSKFGCAVSNLLGYCRLYMKWLTTVSDVDKMDAGKSGDGG